MRLACYCCVSTVIVTWRSGRLCLLSLVSLGAWLRVLLAQVLIHVGG